MELTDLKPRLRETEVLSLLSESVWNPTAEKLEGIVCGYLSNDSLLIFGIETEGRLAGCAGVDLTDRLRGVLHHVAVHPAFRLRGAGRMMIDEIRRRTGVRELEAETDGDAVGFYGKCGFAIEDLGEKYPGTRRYRCVLKG